MGNGADPGQAGVTSTARLSVTGGRVTRMAAGTPQRWSRAQTAANGSLRVIHTLVGDGLFDGECHRTRISASGSGTLYVLGVAATPIRSSRHAFAATKITVGEEAAVCFLPAALVPHAGTSSTHSLVASVARGGSLLAGSIVAAGRTGMGEYGRFHRLRMRTSLTAAGQVELREDAVIHPGETPLDGPALFAGAEVAFTLFAAGTCASQAAACWSNLHLPPDVIAGVSRLRGDGVVLRGLAGSLGAAQAFLWAAGTAAGFPEFG